MNGKVLRLIRNLYLQQKAKIRIEGGTSNTIIIKRWVSKSSCSERPLGIADTDVGLQPLLHSLSSTCEEFEMRLIDKRTMVIQRKHNVIVNNNVLDRSTNTNTWVVG